MSNYRIIVLTEREYDDLGSIIRNGWGDGDFAGYGYANPRTQLSAMRHFDAAAAYPDSGAPTPKAMRADQQAIIEKTYRTP